MKFIVIFLSLFTGSFKQAKEGKSKGFLEGLKIGSILVFILFILNYGIYQNIKLTSIFYYFLLLFISMIGGMVGITRKKEKK